MNDPVILRKKVREVLAMVPTRRFTEPMLKDGIDRMVPEPITAQELATAINWNHSRGLVQSRKNDDTDAIEWFLTDAGKQKEGL